MRNISLLHNILLRITEGTIWREQFINFARSYYFWWLLQTKKLYEKVVELVWYSSFLFTRFFNVQHLAWLFTHTLCLNTFDRKQMARKILEILKKAFAWFGPVAIHKACENWVASLFRNWSFGCKAYLFTFWLRKSKFLGASCTWVFGACSS